ncbi:MAG: SDR family oxidoreductase [Thermomicrobiales bacterium]
MEIRLDTKVALVTGSDSGIGQGIAKALAESGADVVVTWRSDRAGAEETARMVEATGRQALIAHADVADAASVTSLFAALDERFGRLDIMVNNAGIGGGGAVHEMDFDAWMHVIDVNLNGTFRCSQLATQRMLAQGDGGRIINITSVHQEACSSTGSAYNASKAAIRNLTRTQAIELGPHGITVNIIAPGMIVTPMNARAQVDPEYLAWAGEQIPTRRAGYPVDIANMAVFLASDLASYCTGSTFYVDGGWMLTRPPV